MREYRPESFVLVDVLEVMCFVKLSGAFCFCDVPFSAYLGRGRAGLLVPVNRDELSS